MVQAIKWEKPDLPDEQQLEFDFNPISPEIMAEISSLRTQLIKVTKGAKKCTHLPKELAGIFEIDTGKVSNDLTKFIVVNKLNDFLTGQASWHTQLTKDGKALVAVGKLSNKKCCIIFTKSKDGDLVIKLNS